MTSPPASPTPNSPSPILSSSPAYRPSRILLCLILVAGCVTIADLLLKRGAMASHAVPGSEHNLLTTLGIAALASPYTIVGILFHLCGLAAWMYTLRHVPLVLAYCFTAVQQATVALGAWLWLGEHLSPQRWCGIAIVFAGVIVLVPAIITAEHKTETLTTAGGGTS